MNDCNEAVLEAQQEVAGMGESPRDDAPPAAIPARASTMQNEMMDLHRSLDCLLPDSPQKVIQFVSAQPGEGVSTIVREYARTASHCLGHSVLIIDANPAGGGHSGWHDAIRKRLAAEEAAPRLASGIYVSTYPARHGSSEPTSDAEIAGVFQSLRGRYNTVIIDSAPATSAIFSTFFRWVDGVILVVEAEKTRWPVVENLKNRIASNGSRVLGIVLNKRRNYIPDFVYRKL